MKKHNSSEKSIKKRKIYLFSAILLLIAGIWWLLRLTAPVPSLPAVPPSDGYTEIETVTAALALNDLVYGCERENDLSGTVNQILDSHTMGIVVENFGLIREVEDDPASAVWDTADFIRRHTGDFRLLTDLRDPKSGFYGAAFCDDSRKCVWISFAGATSGGDTMTCIGLALSPRLTRQETLAFDLYRAVCDSDEVQKQSYTVMLTGHSLGGALASTVAYVSGGNAVTINGVDGLALDKVSTLLKKPPQPSRIVNYLTSPKGSRLSWMNLLQRLMFLGSDKQMETHVYPENGYTTDIHSVFSFIRFEDEDFKEPLLPSPIS